MIETIAEYKIKEGTRQAISELLAQCFTDYPKHRIFLKQKPSFRILYHADDGQLLGHIAVENRLMSNAGEPIQVYGLADICVHPLFQQKKIATRMIDLLSALAIENDIDYLILVAWEPKVYQNMQFIQVDNPCRWLMIQKDQSLGLAQRRLGGALMIKAVSQHQWKNGLIDFMGTIF